jgi:hypothetical protein
VGLTGWFQIQMFITWQCIFFIKFFIAHASSTNIVLTFFTWPRAYTLKAHGAYGLYGFDRCVVQFITGIYKFLLPQNTGLFQI